MSHYFPSPNGGARSARCHVLVSPKVSLSRAHTRCIHQISFFFSKCCQGNLPWGLVIHSSFPSIPLPTTEVKRLIAQEVPVCHLVSQASLVTLATAYNVPHSLLLCSVFSPEAAETSSVHTDIKEASNSRAGTLKSFIFQKKTGHSAGPAKGPHGAAGGVPIMVPHQVTPCSRAWLLLAITLQQTQLLGCLVPHPRDRTSPSPEPSRAEPGQV